MRLVEVGDVVAGNRVLCMDGSFATVTRVDYFAWYDNKALEETVRLASVAPVATNGITRARWYYGADRVEENPIADLVYIED